MRYRSDKQSRPWLYFRTFPHSNSKRKIADRFKDDEQEALEYTSNFVGNKHGKGEIPSIYDDDFPDCVQKKYIPKAKKSNWDHRKTIRKGETGMEDFENTIWQKFEECDSDCFVIFQIDHDKNHLSDRALRLFSGLKELEIEGLSAPHVDQYDAIYFGKFQPEFLQDGNIFHTLEKLYQRFNIDRPKDFHGHSLSVSDVVAVKIRGEIRFWFVDSISFSEVKGFAEGEMV